jgi:hypothetical protein
MWLVHISSAITGLEAELEAQPAAGLGPEQRRQLDDAIVRLHAVIAAVEGVEG